MSLSKLGIIKGVDTTTATTESDQVHVQLTNVVKLIAIPVTYTLLMLYYSDITPAPGLPVVHTVIIAIAVKIFVPLRRHSKLTV